MTETHGFGGNWTEEKLKRLKKYLKAYATIMRNGVKSKAPVKAGKE